MTRMKISDLYQKEISSPDSSKFNFLLKQNKTKHTLSLRLCYSPRSLDGELHLPQDFQDLDSHRGDLPTREFQPENLAVSQGLIQADLALDRSTPAKHWGLTNRKRSHAVSSSCCRV